MIQQDSAKALLSDSLHNDSTALVDSLHAKDTLLHQSVDTIAKIVEKRFDGILHPSNPSSESWVFVVLFVFFLLFVYSIIRSNGWIGESIKTFFQLKERSSIFSTAAVNDFQSRAVLMVFTIGVFSLYIYLILCPLHQSFAILIWSKILLATIVFLLFKYLIFQLLGYVFFDKKVTKYATTSYFNILSYLGIVLFPCLVLQIYTSYEIRTIIPDLSILACIFGAILVIIKLFQFFFHKIVDFFYILLYLCTLEILPLIILFGVYKLML